MKKVFKILTNKFLIATAAFVVYMNFFDQNDWVTQRARVRQLNETKANIEFLNQTIAQMEKDNEALNNDPAALEKYAREQYRMKRDNEDVYVIEGQ